MHITENANSFKIEKLKHYMDGVPMSNTRQLLQLALGVGNIDHIHNVEYRNNSWIRTKIYNPHTNFLHKNHATTNYQKTKNTNESV